MHAHVRGAVRSEHMVRELLDHLSSHVIGGAASALIHALVLDAAQHAATRLYDHWVAVIGRVWDQALRSAVAA